MIKIDDLELIVQNQNKIIDEKNELINKQKNIIFSLESKIAANEKIQLELTEK